MNNKDKILCVLEALDAHFVKYAGRGELGEREVSIPCIVDGEAFDASLIRDVDFGELYEWLGRADVKEPQP